MEYTYSPTSYEIKLMILYVVKMLKIPCNYTTIDFVISSSADVNYFELEKYITELMNTDNLTSYNADGDKYYAITEPGEETLEFFSGKIPGSIRLKLKENIDNINREKARGNKFFADYIPINENEYSVKLSMEDGGVVIFALDFYAGPKERAIAICSYLRKNTTEFYKAFMEMLDNGMQGKI